MHGNGAASFRTLGDFSQKIFPRSRSYNCHKPNLSSSDFSHAYLYEKFEKTYVTGFELNASCIPHAASTHSPMTSIVTKRKCVCIYVSTYINIIYICTHICTYMRICIYTYTSIRTVYTVHICVCIFE